MYTFISFRQEDIIAHQTLLNSNDLGLLSTAAAEPEDPESEGILVERKGFRSRDNPLTGTFRAQHAGFFCWHQLMLQKAANTSA